MRLWSDDEIELAMRSILILLVVSIVIWYFLRPSPPKNDRLPPQQQARPVPSIQHQQQLQFQEQQMLQQHQRQFANLHERRPGGLPSSRRNNNNNNNNNNDADDGDGDEDGIISMLALNARIPPHTSSSFNSTVAHEGIIPFRYTRASIFESQSHTSSSGGGDADDAVVAASTARQMANRKERARIFTKLFSSTRTENTGIVQPPSRGSNVVLTVPAAEVGCIKLRKVLFLLGSYYNLFVMVALDNNANDDGTASGIGGDGTTDSDQKTTGKSGTITETEQYIQFNSTMNKMESALRGNDNDDAKEPPAIASNTDSAPMKQQTVLPPEVLPSHRIVGTTSIGGRVAFVRQLPKRPEFVLEYEAEVCSQLTRFGFAVLLYSKAGGGSVSGVGKELISG